MVQIRVSQLTSRDDDVCICHGRLDVMFKGRLDELVVLFEDTLDLSSTLGDIALQPPGQADVRVGVDEDLHV